MLQDMLKQMALFEIEVWSGDNESKQEIRDLIGLSEDPFNRKSMPAHITSSALILNKARDCVFLIHHKALNKWLQPGGHFELPLHLENTEKINTVLWLSAQREVLEETGLRVQLASGIPQLLDSPNRALYPSSLVPLDIDVHRIPARPEKGEGEHYHIDFMYAAEVIGSEGLELNLELSEVLDAKWVPLQELNHTLNKASRLYRAIQLLR